MAEVICCECGTPMTASERGWEGHLADLDGDDEDEVAFFCPTCAAREFGPHANR